MGKKDPRVIRTLQCIDDSLLKNLERYSLSKITVDTICKEANINRSTFYKYYMDKYDLLDTFLSRVLLEYKEHMDVTFITASPISIYEPHYSVTLKNVLDYLEDQKDVYQILWNASMERDIYSEMIDITTELILEKMEVSIHRTSKNYIYLKFFAQSFPTNLMMGVKWWFEHKDEVSLDDFTQLIDDTTRDGVFKSFKKLI